MKFVYQYRTSDNVPHQGEISAADRESAFQALRAQGIRPGKLEEAPGFLNRLFGRGKRWLAIGTLLVAVAAAVCVIGRDKRTIRELAESASYVDSEGCARPIERRQIWGDEAVITAAAQQNWRVIFSNPAERLLALFAEPGQVLSMLPRLPATLEEDMKRALAGKSRIAPDELDEYRQMKCIVEGMKAELRAYIAAGGSLKGYIRRLQARQREESDYLSKAQEELMRQIKMGADAMGAWQEMNRRMREQGLPALPMPAAN